MEKEHPYTPILWDRRRLDWCDLVLSPYCDLTPAQKVCLVVLSSYGNAYGQNIYPSQREISFRANVAERSVWAAVKRAEKEGWLIRYKHRRQGGHPYTSYDLAIPAGIQDATMFMKARFWTPPFRYQLVRDGETPKLVKRAS